MLAPQHHTTPHARVRTYLQTNPKATIREVQKACGFSNHSLAYYYMRKVAQQPWPPTPKEVAATKVTKHGFAVEATQPNVPVSNYGAAAHAAKVADSFYQRTSPNWALLRDAVLNAMVVARERQMVRDAAMCLGAGQLALEKQIREGLPHGR